MIVRSSSPLKFVVRTFSSAESSVAGAPSRLHISIGLRSGLALGAGTVLVSSFALRSYYDSLRVRDLKVAVHADASSATIQGVQRQIKPEAAVMEFRDAQGRPSKLVVDREHLERALRSDRRTAELAAAEKRLQKSISESLEREMNACFGELSDRIPRFADWYFAYATGFKLLREAMTSVARHSADISRSVPVRDLVAADMDQMLMRKYERIVLRPELNDSKLQRAFLTCVQQAHKEFCGAVASVDAEILAELAKQTSHLEEPQQKGVHLQLDWSTQLHKVKSVPASFEKAPELTLALSVSGALVGKAMGTAAGSKAIGAVGAKVAGKTMFGKLSSPFVAKALAASSGAIAGALSGPAGALVGGALGLGTDYALNRGLELVQRKDFEDELKVVLKATQQDYTKSMEVELCRAMSIWFADALHVVPQENLVGGRSAD
eukprot:TRINITY_DN41345_c0_g1_i1.p1 TRINITY_DN41345_c0_g1~~TRINITY_DN41345_c0_g1_i1.p1  ORF type:complete len:436 (+),score=76.37 TRINITY_DN41345_c0_g1_i1:62-1369(+)